MSLLPPDGTVLEDVVDGLFCFFAIAECRVHDASLLQVRLQATVSCSQPEHSGLIMSYQTVDWVCRGVVVSSGSFPLTFLSVSEQCFGFLVSGGGHGLQLFAPRLSQTICPLGAMKNSFVQLSHCFMHAFVLEHTTIDP